jgi:hypothetical protein
MTSRIVKDRQGPIQSFSMSSVISDAVESQPDANAMSTSHFAQYCTEETTAGHEEIRDHESDHLPLLSDFEDLSAVHADASSEGVCSINVEIVEAQNWAQIWETHCLCMELNNVIAYWNAS